MPVPVPGPEGGRLHAARRNRQPVAAAPTAPEGRARRQTAPAGTEPQR